MGKNGCIQKSDVSSPRNGGWGQKQLSKPYELCRRNEKIINRQGGPKIKVEGHFQSSLKARATLTCGNSSLVAKAKVTHPPLRGNHINTGGGGKEIRPCSGDVVDDQASLNDMPAPTEVGGIFRGGRSGGAGRILHGGTVPKGIYSKMLVSPASECFC